MSNENQKHEILSNGLVEMIKLQAMMAAKLFATPTFYPGWESWEREKQAVRHAKNMLEDTLGVSIQKLTQLCAQ